LIALPGIDSRLLLVRLACNGDDNFSWTFGIQTSCAVGSIVRAIASALPKEAEVAMLERHVSSKDVITFVPG
jgi:hypothetical protein